MTDLELRLDRLTFSGLDAGPSDGELVLLLHGFPQTSRAFAAEVEALADAGYRAVAPDLRGFSDGARPDGVEGYSLELATGDVLAIATALEAPRFHLVGHDLGGIVAWELACREPTRVRTLSVASTPHLAPFGAAVLAGEAERLPPFELFRQPEVPEQTLLGDDAALLRAAYAGLDQDSIDHYATFFSRPGVLTATLAYFRAFDFNEWLELPPSPVSTLFAWGTEDPFLAPATAQATAAHVSADYRAAELDGVGHWVPELAAGQITELLLEHLGDRA